MAARLAADAAPKAHEAALEHGRGEFMELGLKAFPAAEGITNVLYHTLDYSIMEKRLSSPTARFFLVFPCFRAIEESFCAPGKLLSTV